MYVTISLSVDTDSVKHGDKKVFIQILNYEVSLNIYKRVKEAGQVGIQENKWKCLGFVCKKI